jgi:hypothetical protein
MDSVVTVGSFSAEKPKRREHSNHEHVRHVQVTSLIIPMRDYWKDVWITRFGSLLLLFSLSFLLKGFIVSKVIFTLSALGQTSQGNYMEMCVRELHLNHQSKLRYSQASDT